MVGAAMSGDGGESVLSRWSRRKLAAREREVNSPALAELPESTELSESDESEIANLNTPEPDAPLLTDADMPDIDTLTEESDFSPFMSPGVSDELRKLALRRMFQGSFFNIRDGLDEYDDDYTKFEKLGDVVTSDMKHRIEIEQQKLREKLEAESGQGELLEEGEIDERQTESIPTDEEAEFASRETETGEEVDE